MTTNNLPAKLFVVVTVNPDGSPLVLAVCTEDKLDSHVGHCILGVQQQYNLISDATGKDVAPPPVMVSEVEFAEASEKHVFTGRNRFFVPKHKAYDGMRNAPGKPDLAN